MCSRARVYVRREKANRGPPLWILVVKFSEFAAAPFELPGPKCQAAGRLLLYLGRDQHEWANFCVVLHSLPCAAHLLLLLHAAVCFIISCLKQRRRQRRGRQLLLCTVRARCLLLWKAKWNSKQVGRDLFYHASKAICSNKNIRPRLPVLLTPWPEGTTASACFSSELKCDIFQTVENFPGASLYFAVIPCQNTNRWNKKGMLYKC